MIFLFVCWYCIFNLYQFQFLLLKKAAHLFRLKMSRKCLVVAWTQTTENVFFIFLLTLEP